MSSGHPGAAAPLDVRCDATRIMCIHFEALAGDHVWRTMASALGIDGFRRGWVAVILVDGRFAGADAAARIEPLIAGLGELDAIGVDIPIGLPDAGFREGRPDRPARSLARAGSPCS